MGLGARCLRGKGVRRAVVEQEAYERCQSLGRAGVGMASSWKREQHNEKLVTYRGSDKISRPIKDDGSQLSPYLSSGLQHGKEKTKMTLLVLGWK